MPRMISIERSEVRAARPRGRAALALVSLALLAPSYAAAADNEDVAALRRRVEEVQAEKRELSRRLGALESAREAAAAPRTKPARERPSPAPAAVKPSAVAASSSAAAPLPEPHDTSKMGLEERVKELEVGWAAQENATRQIIQNALSKAAPKTNSSLWPSGLA